LCRAYRFRNELAPFSETWPQAPAAQEGHEVGTYRVQITASRASGKTFTVDTLVLSPGGKKMQVPVMESLILPKYNVASTLRVTITREASAAGVDFSLE
jgi:hypothetical protein